MCEAQTLVLESLGTQTPRCVACHIKRANWRGAGKPLPVSEGKMWCRPRPLGRSFPQSQLSQASGRTFRCARISTSSSELIEQLPHVSSRSTCIFRITRDPRFGSQNKRVGVFPSGLHRPSSLSKIASSIADASGVLRWPIRSLRAKYNQWCFTGSASRRNGNSFMTAPRRTRRVGAGNSRANARRVAGNTVG